MKTTGLNFLEAVQALKDGRCDAIKRDLYAAAWRDYKMPLSGTSSFQLGMEEDVEDILATDWELVNPRKRKKTRTLEGWLNVYKRDTSALHPTKTIADDKAALHDRIACVHVTGTYEVEVDDD